MACNRPLLRDACTKSGRVVCDRPDFYERQPVILAYKSGYATPASVATIWHVCCEYWFCHCAEYQCRPLDSACDGGGAWHCACCARFSTKAVSVYTVNDEEHKPGRQPHFADSRTKR